MKSDRRVRYTKQVIKENFLALLLTKPTKKITVKELCEKAEINRTTFYSHYDDIYSLTEELQTESINEIKKRLLQYSSKGNDMILYFVKILQESHPYYSRYIFIDDNSKYFLRLFLECKDFILSHWISSQQNKTIQTQQEWLYSFLASGSASVLRTWLMGGMKESAEEVADFLNQLIACYDIFLKKNG